MIDEFPFIESGSFVVVHRWPVKEVQRDGQGKRVYVRTAKAAEDRQIEFLGIYGPHAILHFKMAGEYRFSVDSGTCVDGSEMKDWVIAHEDLKKLRRMKATGARALKFSALGSEKEIG